MTPERWQQVKQVLDTALSLDVAERLSYLDKACRADPELRNEVESLIRSDRDAGSRFLNPTAADLRGAAATANAIATRVGRRIGPYDIVKEIGRGGMGEVYRAVRADGQFTKEVALKLVRGGFNSGFLLERFRNERQILAGLDHPNIARLLDGGTTDDGIPYLVMELVEGVPIDTYSDNQNLSVTRRLELFRQVCAAVQYAHQRLVVHRDIKPGNILVGKDGRPKLLDFGIAKIIDDSSNAETTLGRPMTPEYASPEQIRGEPITTATDVYSLGVVLYQLLTGHGPYRVDTRTPLELSRAITDTEPERPSSVILRAEEIRRDGEVRRLTSELVSRTREGSAAKLQRRLTGDLDNIVLKALRKEPERRYASVEQFDEDLRCHLGGLPVSARKDSWRYRTGKFAQRHKLSVSATAVALIALIAGVGLVLHEARVARVQAEIALNERARAEKRFNDVRELANSLIFEIHDSIQSLPGATPARKLLLDRAVQYLDGLAKDSSGDPDLQRELAWGYQRLAVVQGNASESNLGDTKAAEESDRKATALFEAVAKANPKNVIDQLNVAMGHRLLAFFSLAEPGGHPDLDQAMAITERLMKSDGGNPKVRSERSIEYQNLSMAQNAAGDRVHALESARKYQQMREDLMKSNPDYRGVARGVGMSTVRLGVQLAIAGSRAEGLQKIDKGIALYESLAKDAKNPDINRELAISQLKRGEVEMMQGATDEADSSIRQARSTIEVMANGDRQNTMLQVDMTGVEYEEGRLLVLTGKYAAAISKLEDARKEAATLGSSAELSQGSFYLWIGQAQVGMHLLREALESYKQAAATLEAPSEGPVSDDTRCELATSYVKIGDVLAKMESFQEASAAYEKALKIADAFAFPEHQDVPAFYPAADAYAGLGDIAAAQARKSGAGKDKEQSELWEAACAAYEKSVSLWQRIPNPSHISPSGFEAGDPREVARRRAECKTQPVVADAKKPSH